MKIAFSDYDGTLSVPEEGVATETIASIHAWRDAGNKFGIVKGLSDSRRFLYLLQRRSDS